MVNPEIRLIIFFAAKDGEALYSQQKQDQEPTVAQIMNSLLPKKIYMHIKYYSPWRLTVLMNLSLHAVEEN